MLVSGNGSEKDMSLLCVLINTTPGGNISIGADEKEAQQELP